MHAKGARQRGAKTEPAEAEHRSERVLRSTPTRTTELSEGSEGHA
ncbi:hypothetical protein [Thermaurantimonas sp.]